MVADSGSTLHIVNRKDILHDPQPCHQEVIVGDGDKVISKLKGTVIGDTKLGKIKLEDEVYYVENFAKMILSTGKILKKNEGTKLIATADTMNCG